MNQNEKLLQSIGNIDDNYVSEASKVAHKSPLKRWMMPMAASVVLTVALSGGYLLSQHNDVIPNANPEGIGGISDTSPMEARKIFNYNGLRYAYDQNLIPEQHIQLGKELAIITDDISKDPENLATKDCAGTFTPGSKIYAVIGYSEEFRLAVSDGYSVYICQVTDTVGEGALNLKTFFQDIGFPENITELVVFNHFGEEILTEISKENAEKLLVLISNAQEAKLDSNAYEKIASCQVNGKSFLVESKLADGTVYQFYAIPEMGLVMIGDNTYKISSETQNLLLNLMNNH